MLRGHRRNAECKTPRDVRDQDSDARKRSKDLTKRRMSVADEEPEPEDKEKGATADDQDPTEEGNPRHPNGGTLRHEIECKKHDVRVQIVLPSARPCLISGLKVDEEAVKTM